METFRFVPKNTPYLEAHFLTDDEQKTYEDATKRFKNEWAQQSLNIPKYGSNLFKIVLLNEIGIRTATLAELDQIVLQNNEALKGTYEDTPSLVLRSSGDPYPNNDYLTKSIAKLIRKISFKQPIVVNGLRLVEDKNSFYGLNFAEGNNFDYFEAPELSQENNGRKFNVLDERGMPIFDTLGNRILYTRKDGLSRLYLDLNLYVLSDFWGLDISSDDGRVVIVKPAEQARKK